MNFGDVLIKAAAALAVAAFVAAWRWARGHAGSERTFRWAYHGMTACLAAASVMLMAAILLHDFRFEYVIGYSSRDLPAIYLVSAFWAGQAGTYLLWALLGAVIGLPLMRRGAWEPAAVMTAYVPTVGFLVSLMLNPEGNPFRMAAHAPPDGRGLNLLLQDPWMASHPPLVFLGYAAMTVPAVLALVALWKRTGDAWLAPALRWTLAAFLLLGAGIVLGGFWAYKVLGWGGYWGWDPVENASLVPWLVAAALLHGILVQNATGALRRTNWALALLGYVLVLYATFLTRSGVLADFSVHSFPAGSIYFMLVAILLGSLGVSAFAWVRRLRARGTAIETTASWPLVLAAVIVLLAISATFVLVGTSWPIVSSLIGEPAALAAPFYNRVSLPLYVALLALLAIAPFLGWGAAPAKTWIGRAAPSVLVAGAGTAAAFAWGARGAGTLGLFFAALAALTSNLVRFARVTRVRPLHTGAALSHIGFALMLLGIVSSSSWGVNDKVRLPLGHPVDAVGRIFTFRGHVDGSEPQDLWRIAVMRPGEAETTAHVAMFQVDESAKEPSVFRRPAILRGWGGDLYVAPLGVEGTARDDGPLQLVRDRPAPCGEAILTFLGFEVERLAEGHGMNVVARVRVERGEREEMVELPFGSIEGELRGTPVSSELLGGGTIAVQRLSVEGGFILVYGDAFRGVPSQVLVAEISTKPLIGLLWTGTLVLGLGCLVAVARRYVERTRVPAAEAEPVRARTPHPAARQRRNPGRAAARSAATARETFRGGSSRG